jgi:hypothetical protein
MTQKTRIPHYTAVKTSKLAKPASYEDSKQQAEEELFC